MKPDVGCIPAVPALGRLIQEDCGKFKGSLDYSEFKANLNRTVRLSPKKSINKKAVTQRSYDTLLLLPISTES